MTLRRPHNQYSDMRVPPFREQEQTLAEARVNGGMVTVIDPADIENSQFVLVKNASVRYDKTTRRFGSVLYSPAKPDSNKVLALVPFERFDGTVQLIRMTPSSIFSGTSLTWNAVTGALSGGADDRFNTTIANDRFFFTNNGADYIQELNPTALTFARAGNAPKYKYLTSFNNRILGAYEVGGTNNPIKVGWSGNLNFTEWDAAVDQSAGFEPLIDSPTDYADPITGIFGLESVALILRQRSLWIVNKQPVATSPFVFDALAPGLGCNAPYSAVPIKNGIAWFDLRTGSVYAFRVGMQEPEKIGTPVEKSIVAQVEDPATVFASYSTVDDEYILCVPNSLSNTVRMWTYNFRTQAWWEDETSSISTLNNIDYNSSSLVINELVGTIDDLIGNIDNLTNDVATTSRFYGKANGDLLVQQKTVDTDNTVPYTTTLQSKIYSIPKNGAYLTELRIDYQPLTAGSFTVSYSKDGGVNWTALKTISWTGLDSDERKRAVIHKHLKCDFFSWKLESTSGLFDILNYEIIFTQSQADTRSR